VEKRLDEHERLCGSCGRTQVQLGSEPRRHLVCL
jgi:hypothetical protein